MAIWKKRPTALVILLCGGTGALIGLPPAIPYAAAESYQASAAASGRTVGNDSCSRMAGAKIGNVDIVSAETQPANAVLKGLNGSVSMKGLPAFCRVVARARPTSDSSIGFEVWLPSTGWNGRMYGAGIGGFAGFIDYHALSSAVASNNVGLSTDMGHQGAIMDPSWAKGHPEKIRDYEYRAVHVTTLAAKQLVAMFFGRGPDHSYFVGCSGGGRQGLMEAARYPEDYDGVVAGAPAASWTGLSMTMLQAGQAQQSPGAAFLPTQMELLQSEVIKQCDKLDGQADGLVSDPRRCRIDTTKLLCGISTSSQCFSKAQVGALESIYRGPRDSRGRSVTPSYLPAGAEAGPLGWAGYILKEGNGPTRGQLHADGLYQNFIQIPFPTSMTFDFDKDPARLRRLLSSDLDAPAGLRQFFARGGKLVLWHGWADPAIPPEATLQYYDNMRAASGPRSSRSSRLFMVPNLQHCIGGNGPTVFGQAGAPSNSATPEDNIVAALQNWVEHGTAPEALIASFGGANPFDPSPAAPAKKHLLCSWPNRPVLKNGSDPDSAASYRCEKST